MVLARSIIIAQVTILVCAIVLTRSFAFCSGSLAFGNSTDIPPLLATLSKLEGSQP